MLLRMLIYYTFNRMNITIIVKHDHNNNNKYNYQWYTIIYILKCHDIDNNYINEGGHGYN